MPFSGKMDCPLEIRAQFSRFVFAYREEGSHYFTFSLTYPKGRVSIWYREGSFPEKKEAKTHFQDKKYRILGYDTYRWSEVIPARLTRVGFESYSGPTSPEPSSLEYKNKIEKISTKIEVVSPLVNASTALASPTLSPEERLLIRTSKEVYDALLESKVLPQDFPRETVEITVESFLMLCLLSRKITWNIIAGLCFMLHFGNNIEYYKDLIDKLFSIVRKFLSN